MVDGSPPPGWSSSAYFFCGGVAHSGLWAAEEANPASMFQNILLQDIPTSPGVSYDFSFWLAGGPGPPSDFTASFGSARVLTLQNVPNPFPYTFEDFTVTATMTLTTLAFTAFTAGGTWDIDDASVTAITAALEPSSWVLLTTGLIGFLAPRTRATICRAQASRTCTKGPILKEPRPALFRSPARNSGFPRTAEPAHELLG
jgi:hypothetical protein